MSCQSRKKGNTSKKRLKPEYVFIPVAACAFVMLMLLLTWTTGCVRYEPQISGTPTPTASPTPLPDPFTAEVTEIPTETDRLGRIIETEDHYFRYYLSFGDMRVYEYETGTFLDGVAVNAYPTALKGEVSAVFRNAEGKVVGRGTLHLADGSTVLPTGTSNIYAEIITDITVQDMDFTLEVDEPFVPAEE